MKVMYRTKILWISLSVLILFSCKLELGNQYETITDEYFKTQIRICIAQRFKNCRILGLNLDFCTFDSNRFEDGCSFGP